MAAGRGLTYIDLHPAFRDENGILDRAYSLDGLHLNGKGYLKWKSMIQDLVRE
jgi:lysophospholipase L1-like esterase